MTTMATGGALFIGAVFRFSFSENMTFLGSKQNRRMDFE
jgi:hypothetical protein